MIIHSTSRLYAAAERMVERPLSPAVFAHLSHRISSVPSLNPLAEADNIPTEKSFWATLATDLPRESLTSVTVFRSAKAFGRTPALAQNRNLSGMDATPFGTESLATVEMVRDVLVAGTAATGASRGDAEASAIPILPEVSVTRVAQSRNPAVAESMPKPAGHTVRSAGLQFESSMKRSRRVCAAGLDACEYWLVCLVWCRW